MFPLNLILTCILHLFPQLLFDFVVFVSNFFLCRLDVGDGKELDLKECPRSKLRQQCIKYLGPVRVSMNQFSIVIK